MYAQLTYFDGPRSGELIAAADRAGRERIMPAMAAHPRLSDEHVATYVLRQPDGGEVVIVFTKTEEALRSGRELIRTMPLLPGEDPALLPGPDRVEMYQVVFSGSLAESGQPS